MPITLPPALQEKIDERVRSGAFASPEAVIGAALALLDEHERNRDWLDAEVIVGIQQADRGELIDYGEGFFDRALRRAIENHRASKPIRPAVLP